MGNLLYGSGSRLAEFDDRVLAHLKVVIVAKLRREEKFTFSWASPTGDGRHTVWVHPAIELHFEFAENVRPQLNRAWVEQMMVTANNGELTITPEPNLSDEAPTGRQASRT
ncbi:hypothetical protein KPL76_03660 [Subtercola sp. PAMC28395]|nr:hypothetical protein [Subtercola sp. PAMC28395]QWT25256.1 hypothetical protein KPL76_03660 [Subtercola sp. PAMC28395]